jgi:transcription initiation factor TFIIIB Brf1 subunit/transcription initiation factor TFIIB
MQGVQGTWKSGRTKLAAYEDYGLRGICPECREGLVYTGEEGGELVCSFCGVVVRTSGEQENTPSAQPGTASEPLGSFIVANEGAAPSLRSPAFGWARLMPNVIGRGGPTSTCSQMTERVAEKLGIPKSVVQQANAIANRLLPSRKTYNTSIPAISAYSLLYASRSAGIAHVSHREILAAYKDAGHNVGKSHLLRIGLESSLPLPQASVEELVRASLGRLQSSQTMATRLRKANQDPKAYFTSLFELAKEVAAQTGGTGGFSPRTVAAGSVYVASLTVLEKKTLTQREAAETLGIAEYTVREFCGRTRHETMAASGPLPVKSGIRLRRHDGEA